MNVTKGTKVAVKCGDIARGDVFKFGEDAYIKSDEPLSNEGYKKCINVATGVLIPFTNDCDVTPLPDANFYEE